MRELFYLAKGNIVGGISVFKKPPIKIFHARTATVCWSGSGGEDGRMIVCFYALDKLIPSLKQPPGTCMKVEVETDMDLDRTWESVTTIKVLDRNVDCETSYH